MEIGAIFPDGNGWSLYQLWHLIWFAVAMYVGVLLLIFFGGSGSMR